MNSILYKSYIHYTLNRKESMDYIYFTKDSTLEGKISKFILNKLISKKVFKPSHY